MIPHFKKALEISEIIVKINDLRRHDRRVFARVLNTRTLAGRPAPPAREDAQARRLQVSAFSLQPFPLAPSPPQNVKQQAPHNFTIAQLDGTASENIQTIFAPARFFRQTPTLLMDSATAGAG
jgi:hypothetical protein